MASRIEVVQPRTTVRIGRVDRQTVRRLALLFSFAVFPITVIYLSPAPPLMSLKEGVVNLSVIVLGTIFVSGFLFRRAFCGWICPGAGCQLVAKALNDRPIEHRRPNLFRILIVSVWAVMVIGTVVVGGIARVDPAFPGGGRFATSEIRWFLPYIPVVVFMFLFVLMFGRNGFCHRGCWISPIILASTHAGRLLRAPSLHVEVRDPAGCADCRKCAKDCPMGIDVPAVVRDRLSFPNSCVQCGACIDSCSQSVLGFHFSSEPRRQPAASAPAER